MPRTWNLDRTAEGVLVHGEVDLAAAEPFGEQILEAVTEASAASVLIDLFGVTFMDSAGLRALVRVLKLRIGKHLIVQSSPQVFTLLHLASLTDGALPNVEVRRPPDDEPIRMQTRDEAMRVGVVLELVALGLSSREISRRLFLIRQTATYHIDGNLLERLDVPTRTGLIIRAYALGLLEPGHWSPRLCAPLSDQTNSIQR